MISGWLLRALQRLFGRPTTSRVFEPLLADWHADARLERTLRARLAMSCRWSCALARAAASAAWHYGVRPDRHPASAVASVGPVMAFSLVGTCILLLPFIRWWGRPGFGPLVVYVIPQALGLALPFALLPGAMSLGATASAGTSSTEQRRLVALVALVVATTAVNLAWVMPLANQAWRVEVAGHDVRPGVRELTLQQLRSGTPMAGITSAGGRSRGAHTTTPVARVACSAGDARLAHRSSPTFGGNGLPGLLVGIRIRDRRRGRRPNRSVEMCPCGPISSAGAPSERVDAAS